MARGAWAASIAVTSTASASTSASAVSRLSKHCEGSSFSRSRAAARLAGSASTVATRSTLGTPGIALTAQSRPQPPSPTWINRKATVPPSSLVLVDHDDLVLFSRYEPG